MIFTKKDLREYIDSDNQFLRPDSPKAILISNFAAYPARYIKRYMYFLRKQEYFINSAKGNKIKGLLGLWYERKKNKLGMKLGIEIGPNCFGKGLSIWHYGCVIINTEARVGDNCVLHGNNCIGNNGKNLAAPRIGNNVDIGFGAVVIGDIEIADNVVIGANAVVNKSILEPGSLVVGIPGEVKVQRR